MDTPLSLEQDVPTTVRRLLGASRRVSRSRVYVSLALEQAGAQFAAALWMRRNGVVSVERGVGDEVLSRSHPPDSAAHVAFDAALRSPAGPLDPDLNLGLLLPRFESATLSAPPGVTWLLPEGTGRCAPRIVVQGADPDRLDQLVRVWNALEPHWVEKRRLRQLAWTDHLTGVRNYRYLRRFLANACRCARNGGAPFAIIMLDLDYLREYNETYGHLMGSRVLARLGRVFREHLRDGDMVAKYGGDEFVAVLPGSSKADAVEVAIRLRRHVNRQSFYGVSAGTITCSLGVAAFGEDGITYPSLVASADRATYAAKARGRNMVVVAGAEKTADSGEVTE